MDKINADITMQVKEQNQIRALLYLAVFREKLWLCIYAA